MNLRMEDGQSFDSPNAETIEAALCILDGEINGYAIMFVSETTFLQTAGSPAEGFVIEYRDGEGAVQMGTVRKDMPITRVVPVFQKYAVGESSWKSGLEWEKVDLRSPSWSARSMVTVIVIIVLGLILYFTRR